MSYKYKTYLEKAIKIAPKKPYIKLGLLPKKKKPTKYIYKISGVFHTGLIGRFLGTYYKRLTPNQAIAYRKKPDIGKVEKITNKRILKKLREEEIW